jgi:predicted amidohydrolase YtcJ
MHRIVLAWFGAVACAFVLGCAPSPRADLVVLNARVTTLNEDQPDATAFAVRDGLFVEVGDDAEVREHIGPSTLVIDANRRRVIPGLNDSHIHATRAGRFYNAELRWDGVPSLDHALRMVSDQAARTPKGQWVRVVGAWSPYQFRERRLPTPAELTAAAPNTPVFVLFLYSKGYLNRAGVAALGLSAETVPPPGSRIEFTPDGGAILHAEPSPVILYQTVAALPSLSDEDQINSTLHFYRELNRFGITSVVDPGGGGHDYPDDYAATDLLAREGRLNVRVGLYLFASKPGGELDQFRQWAESDRIGVNRALELLEGYTTDGAGENIVVSAADYENFMAPRPELSPRMEDDLRNAVAFLVTKRWPIRIHATYDESISRMLDVFEDVNRETPFEGLRIAVDHAETISPRNIERLRALGAGVAIQNRMAYAGEAFLERYGAEAASIAPPLRALVDAGIPLGAGTDATRVSGHNPWLSLYWMVSGNTLGGTVLYPPDNRLSREEALRLYTVGSAWFTADEDAKGRISPGQFADFALLSADFMTIPEEQIKRIESVLTVVEGRPVYAASEFADTISVPDLPPPSPPWSPVRRFGGYHQP